MKKILVVTISVVTISALFTASVVSAQQQSTQMTDAHMQRIQQNCSEAIGSLQQIHTNDRLVRVNRGQAYDSMSTKLMAPMNSRLALNKLDGSSLVKITASYDQELASFRANYKKYDDQMSSVLQMDCRRQPVAFYDAVAKARASRELVHQNTLTLNRLIIDYEAEFVSSRSKFEQSSTGGSQ